MHDRQSVLKAEVHVAQPVEQAVQFSPISKVPVGQGL